MFTGLHGEVALVHRNPVMRGLVARPEDWTSSSFRHYLNGEAGLVESNRRGRRGRESWPESFQR